MPGAVAANRAEYCASKAAAAMVSSVFAVRLANEDIQVFDVRPGLIETDMTRPAKESYERRIREDGLTLVRRMGQPDDVARIVTTLATGGWRSRPARSSRRWGPAGAAVLSETMTIMSHPTTPQPSRPRQADRVTASGSG